MKTKSRPVILKIAAIVLAVLILFSAGLALARNYGLLPNAGFAGRQGLGARRFTGNFQNGNGNGNFQTFQNGNGTGTSPNDNGTGTGTFQNGTGTGTFQRSSTAFALTRVLRTVTLYLNYGLLVFGLLAVVGVWMVKKWGAVLAIISSILVFLTTVPGLLRINFATWLTITEAVVKILLAVAVIVLLLLPASRKAYATQQV
jgi:hypothetical protein